MRKIKTDSKKRVETGALQINDDWVGLFIRGDSCIELMGILKQVLDGEPLNVFEKKILEMYASEIEENVLVK